MRFVWWLLRNSMYSSSGILPVSSYYSEKNHPVKYSKVVMAEEKLGHNDKGDLGPDSVLKVSPMSFFPFALQAQAVQSVQLPSCPVYKNLTGAASDHLVFLLSIESSIFRLDICFYFLTCREFLQWFLSF